MERSHKNNIILKIVCASVLTFYAMYFVGVPLIKSTIRKLELRRLPYYVVYDSPYDSTEEYYNIYIMINDDKSSLSEVDKIKNLITDDFVAQMREVPRQNPLYGNLYEKFGDRKIRVYLLLPTADLSYGWEKSYDNIRINVDFSIIRNAERAELIIPIGAASPDNCRLTFK